MGKLMVVATRFLSLCAVLLMLPAITVAQPTPLAVQRVWTQGAGGNIKTIFAPGETIQFVAKLNNSYGGTLLAANGTQLAITTSFYNNTKPVDIPPSISTWTWNATAPSTEANYTATVKAYDHFYGRWAEGSASFAVVAGQSQLPPEQLTPNITQVETFREGDLVFFRLFFTDPNNDARGFGFRGANGSLWAEATFPFSSPSYGRVTPGRIEYPFNHLCETGPAYESDVEVWLQNSIGDQITPPVTVHLACAAPVFVILGPAPGQQPQGPFEGLLPPIKPFQDLALCAGTIATLVQFHRSLFAMHCPCNNGDYETPNVCWPAVEHATTASGERPSLTRRLRVTTLPDPACQREQPTSLPDRSAPRMYGTNRAQHDSCVQS